MDAYVGEIRLMPYNYAPRGWAQCLGQVMPISQNTALFSILGVTYGGNGTTNFALPNFSGATAIGAGNGPGLSPYVLGESLGTTGVTLELNQIPAHIHAVSGSILSVAEPGGTTDPTNGYLAFSVADEYGEAAGNTDMAPNVVTGGPTSVGGGGQPHDNMMPYLTLNYCICLQGIFPQRP